MSTYNDLPEGPTLNELADALALLVDAFDSPSQASFITRAEAVRNARALLSRMGRKVGE